MGVKLVNLNVYITWSPGVCNNLGLNKLVKAIRE